MTTVTVESLVQTLQRGDDMRTVTVEWGLPGVRAVPQLHHVGVVLGQDGHRVTLLANHQPRLLLVGVAQVDPVELK